MPTRKAASKKSPPRGSGAGKSKAPSKSKGQSTVTGLKKEPVGSTEGNTESKKRKMERRMSADKISAHLVKRPAPARVAKVAPTGFTVTKNKLERRMSANKIETHLRGREGKGLVSALRRWGGTGGEGGGGNGVEGGGGNGEENPAGGSCFSS